CNLLKIKAIKFSFLLPSLATGMYYEKAEDGRGWGFLPCLKLPRWNERPTWFGGICAMKRFYLLSLPLAAALSLPAAAQQNSNASSDQQSAPAQQQAQSSDQQQGNSAHEPLKYERKEGFWGKINPFARKKYVNRQLDPIRGRVNELDELTAKNAR